MTLPATESVPLARPRPLLRTPRRKRRFKPSQARRKGKGVSTVWTFDIPAYIYLTDWSSNHSHQECDQTGNEKKLKNC